VIGVDVSERSIDEARSQHTSSVTHFATIAAFAPGATLDLVFCNGVFHHIPVSGRATAVDYIARTLRPGGVFALWENNPWNPGTRYVMSRIAFDRDAVMLTPGEVRRLLSTHGFEVLRTDFLFVFPRLFRALRPAEKLLRRVPVGAQYQVLARKC
jgi:SAM-dependent methyltransferase